MGSEGVALALSLDYFFPLVSSSGGSGRLRGFPLLPHFRNCEIKNTGLTHYLWSLRAILTELILVSTHTQLMTYFWLGGLK